MAAERKSLEPYLKDEVEYYPHQVEGIRSLAKLPSFLLADDMGLGKSLQALTVFCIDVKMGLSETLIIVCPTTLRDNWAEEIEKFTRIEYTLLGEERVNGKLRKLAPLKRHQQLLDWLAKTGPRILICNYEQIASSTHEHIMRTMKVDVLILDESHKIKNPKSARTKAILKLRSRRKFLLSGTPMLNQVDELWTSLRLILPQKYPNYWQYVNRHCAFGGYKGKAIVGSKNTKDLKDDLSKIMLRRLKDDVLDRTKPTYVKVKVGLSETQRKLYDQAAQDLILSSPTGSALDIQNALTKFLRLKQICVTPRCIDPSFPDESAKLDQVMDDLIQTTSGPNAQKVIVFTQFRGVLDALSERWAKATKVPAYYLHGDVPMKERVPIVNTWSTDGQPSVIFCMLQVAGVGLNMTAASQVFMVDKDFVPGLNKQAVDRADRIGQTKPVMVREYIAAGTIEDRVEKILSAKIKEFDELIEGSAGMRSLLQKLMEKMKNDLS